MKILGLGGSIRANPRCYQTMLSTIAQAADLPDYIRRIKELTPPSPKGIGNPGFLSNTEVCAGAALLGAKEAKADIDFFPLSALFPRRSEPVTVYATDELGLFEDINNYDHLGMDEIARAELTAKIRQADGIILSSPVYFGDRSSISNKIMQIAQQDNLFTGKFVASVAAGAKRNGGQETTNVFHLQESLSLGAYALGNGPSSAQYGGTVVAGDLGTAAMDEKGLQTCYGTGKRMAQVTSLFDLPPIPLNRELRVVALVTMDTPERALASALKAAFASQPTLPSGVAFDIVQLVDGQIERCLACSICPIPELLSRGSYGCIINTQRDTMEQIRERLLNADALIFAGLNLGNMSSVRYRYQAFTERTRFIRRNDFELTNLPVTSYTLEEVGANGNAIFPLKVMVSYIRHNTILCPPIREIRHQGQVLVSPHHALSDFLQRAEVITARRQQSEGFSVSYQAGKEGGYRDDRLNHTHATRT